MISGKVPNFGLKWSDKYKRGKMVTIKEYNSSTPALARNMIDQNLAVHGGSLFNLLPEKLRSFLGMIDEFKIQLVTNSSLQQMTFPGRMQSSTIGVMLQQLCLHPTNCTASHLESKRS